MHRYIITCAQQMFGVNMYLSWYRVYHNLISGIPLPNVLTEIIEELMFLGRWGYEEVSIWRTIVFSTRKNGIFDEHG